MKKIISFLLMIMLVVASVPSFASSEESDKMQQVLLAVKSKIEIPAELSEFSGHVSNYNDRITYRFEWTSPDYEKNISVTSDEKGRVMSYYNNSFKTSDKRLSDISKSELVSFASDFLIKTAPDTYINENDLFVYDEDSFSAMGSLSYNIGFVRQKDGIKVKNNSASVNLCIVDGQIKVRSMNVNYDYDAQFEQTGSDIDNYALKYKELFPVELVYQNEYNTFAKRNEPRYTPVLVYRIKDNDIGYMDANTGEVVKEDAMDIYFSKNESASDSMISGGSGGGSSLTPEEIAELEKIEGLDGKDDIEKLVKKLPYINFTDELVLTNSRLYKDVYDKYYYTLEYETSAKDNYDYISFTVNAKSGEVVSLSNNFGEYEKDKVLSEAEKQQAENKIKDFLNTVIKDKFATTQKEELRDNNCNVTIDYTRIVNGVRYINNGINVTYNTKNNIITYYNCNFTDGEFANPENAIGDAKAYDNILEYAPVVPMYIKSDGIYKKVFTLDKTNVTVDGISGEIKNKQQDYSYHYSDISGHWVEAKANKLAENQIGIKGDELMPEKEITQSELLYLLCDAIYGKYYSDYSIDQLYENLIRNGIITNDEKNPDSFVKREDAFVFVIRMAGFEKIAKLENIFKVSYADGDLLSKGKIGYAAILSGLGIICGDGGNIRPLDNLTRAEAITIVYNYLLSY